MKKLTHTWRQQKPVAGRENVKPLATTVSGFNTSTRTTTKRLGQHAVARTPAVAPSTTTATPPRNMVDAKKRKVLSPRANNCGQDHNNGGELRRSPRFKGGESNGNQASTARGLEMKRRSPRLLRENGGKSRSDSKEASPHGQGNSSFNSSFGTDIDMNEDFLLALEQVEADYQDKNVEGHGKNVKGQGGASKTEINQSNIYQPRSSGNETQRAKSGFVKFVKHSKVDSSEITVENGSKNTGVNKGMVIKSIPIDSKVPPRTSNSLSDNSSKSLGTNSSRQSSSVSASNLNQGGNKSNQGGNKLHETSTIKWTDKMKKFPSQNKSLTSQKQGNKSLANQNKATHFVQHQLTNGIPCTSVSNSVATQNKNSDSNVNVKWTDQLSSNSNHNGLSANKNAGISANGNTGTRNASNQMIAPNSTSINKSATQIPASKSTTQTKTSVDQNSISRSKIHRNESCNLNENKVTNVNPGKEFQKLDKQKPASVLNMANEISSCNSKREMCNSNSTTDKESKQQGHDRSSLSVSRNVTRSSHSSHQSSSVRNTIQASELQSPQGPPPVTRMKKLLVAVSPPDTNVKNSPVGEILCEDSQSPGYDDGGTSKRQGKPTGHTQQKPKMQTPKNSKAVIQTRQHDNGPIQHIDYEDEDDLHSSQGFETSHLSPPQNKSQASPPMNKSLMSPSHNSPDPLAIASWGLPDAILKQYHENKVTHMFPWQGECLRTGNVLDGGNLVYSAPTSAGKTLVAELLIMKRVLETKKKALFILPFVSVCREKMFYLQNLLQDAGIRVDGYMGKQGASGGFGAVDVAICTIERANSLINRLLEESKLHQLGVIVVDELHMVGDSNRGYLLELLLTKIRYVTSLLKDSKKKQNDDENNESQIILDNPIQIIGMSATLPNLGLLAKWLDADLYTTDYRPVPLTETVKIGPVIYDQSMNKLRDFVPIVESKGDEENILSLCLETILEGCSVLVFCPTKNWCEKLCENMAREIARTNGMLPTKEKGFVPASKRATVLSFNIQGLMDTVEQLKRTPAGIDSVLKRTVPFGVAYHHAGLTFDERDIIEGSFRLNNIRILVATSTLSSGVNLPARRVIIRSIMFNRKVLDPLTYKQMAGRAGRKGVDTLGESILICKSTERPKVTDLLKTELPPVQSCLKRREEDDLSSSMKRAILEVIASGVASSPSDVEKYASSTLLAASMTSDPDDPDNKADGHLDTNTSAAISDCVKFLRDREFITLQKVKSDGETHEVYKPSQLGSATLASALTPDEALVVFAELQRARKSFVLENELHIIYQVTPIYSYGFYPDWYQFICQWEHLSGDKRRVAELVGVEERFLVRAARGNIPKHTAKQQHTLAIHNRFYVALILNDLVNEMPLNAVARKYACARGQLQSLQQNAATFAGMVTVFCSKLGWYNMELLLNQFQNRLNFGVQRELCDLVRISLLNAYRARLLYNNGFHSVADVANAKSTDIEHLLKIAVPFQSSRKAIDEQQYEAEERRQTRCIWATGRKGLTESEAAAIIVSEAQQLVQGDLGLSGVQWGSARKDGGSNPNMDNKKQSGGTGGVGQKQTVSIGASGRNGSLKGHGTNNGMQMQSVPRVTSGRDGSKTDNSNLETAGKNSKVSAKSVATSSTGVLTDIASNPIAQQSLKDDGTSSNNKALKNSKGMSSNSAIIELPTMTSLKDRNDNGSTSNRRKSVHFEGHEVGKQGQSSSVNQVASLSTQGQRSSVTQVASFTQGQRSSVKHVASSTQGQRSSVNQVASSSTQGQKSVNKVAISSTQGQRLSVKHVASSSTQDQRLSVNHVAISTAKDQRSSVNQVASSSTQGQRSSIDQVASSSTKSSSDAIEIIKEYDGVEIESIMNMDAETESVEVNSERNGHHNQVVIQAEVHATRSQSTNASNGNRQYTARNVTKMISANSEMVNEAPVTDAVSAITRPVENSLVSEKPSGSEANVHRPCEDPIKGSTPNAIPKDQVKMGKDTSPELFSVPEDFDLQTLDLQTLDVQAASTPNDVISDGNLQMGASVFKNRFKKSKQEAENAQVKDGLEAMLCGNNAQGNNVHQRISSHDLRTDFVGDNGVCISSPGGQSDFSPSFPPMDSQMLRLVDEMCAQNDAIAKTASPDLQRNARQCDVNLSKMPIVSFNKDLGTLEVNEIDLESCPLDMPLNTQQLLDDAVAMDTSDSFDFPADDDEETQIQANVAQNVPEIVNKRKNSPPVSPDYSGEDNLNQNRAVSVQNIRVPEITNKKQNLPPVSPEYSQLQADMELAAHWCDSFSCEETSPQPQVQARSCDETKKQPQLRSMASKKDNGRESIAIAANNGAGRENIVAGRHGQNTNKCENSDRKICATQRTNSHIITNSRPGVGQHANGAPLPKGNKPQNTKTFRDRRKSSTCDISSALQDQFSPGTMAMLDMFAGEDDSGMQSRSMVAPKQGMMGNKLTNQCMMGKEQKSASAIVGSKGNERKGFEPKSTQIGRSLDQNKDMTKRSGRKRKSDEFVTDAEKQISPPKKNKDSNANGTDISSRRVSPRRLGKTSEDNVASAGSDERRTSDGDFIPPTPPPKEKPNTPKLVKGTLRKNGRTPGLKNASSGVVSRRSSQRIRSQTEKSQIGQNVTGRGKINGAVKSVSKNVKKTLDLSPPGDSQDLFSERDGIDSQLCDMNKALDASDLDLRLDTSSDSASSPKHHNPSMPSSSQVIQSSPTIPCTDGAFTIIDVCSARELFETFLEEWRSQVEYSFSLACESYRIPVEGGGIGGNFRRANAKKSSAKPDGLVIEDEGVLVTGLAVCWGDKDAYFISFQNTPSQDADESLAQPLPDPDLPVIERLHSVKSILEMVHGSNPGHTNQRKCMITKMAFDLKQQYKALARSFDTVVGGNAWDPKVAHWLFDPGAKEKNLQGLVTQYLPQETHLLEDIGGGIGVGGLGLTAKNPGSGRLRASTESVLVHMLMRPLTDQLKEQGLHKSFEEVEMPSQVTIARMELNGFGFSAEECETQKTIMQAKLTALEEQAYQMAGHGFMLTSPDEVAQVLYAELKLPPNGDPKQANMTFRKTLGARGRMKLPKHFSTTKDALEKLKAFHELPGIILEWRRITSAITKVVFPMQNEKVYNEDLGMDRIYGLCTLHTATGRVAMSDPNLQAIPKDFEIQMPSIIGESPPQGTAPPISCLNAPTPNTRGRGRHGAATRGGVQQRAEMGHGSQEPSFSVSVRHAFCPFPGGVLIAADYSQLELRILAHLARDGKLIAILNSGGDVFKQIAAKWKNTTVEEITAEQRQQAKQVCYGMIYGIGAKALGETLGVGEEDGGAFMETFKMQYKGMRTYMTNTVKECKEKGYVTTMMGRRRYLTAIHNTNAGTRNHAERQAINTTIQGSAADLVKKAMNNIDKRLAEEFPNTRRTHRHKGESDSTQSRRNRRTQQSHITPSGAFLVLQLHDELIYEVNREDVIQVAQLVKMEMESAMKLAVRLPVKVNVGPTWGSMEALEL